MLDIKNFTFSELQKFLMNKKLPSYCANQIFNWLYKKGVDDFDSMTDVSKDGRIFFKNHFYLSKLKENKHQTSNDKTSKYLFELEDQNLIETVLIPEGDRNTLCVSTQVGCKFKCTFCASGKNGFKRDLSISEIVNQYLTVSRAIAPQNITNIVFMGIGEPLDNFSNTIGAVSILTEPQGLNISRERISISTCGLIPEIEKLAELDLGIKLSVSLHSPDNDRRTKLMPINQKYPLNKLIEALKTYGQNQKHPVTFEYIMIKNYNMAKIDVANLGKLLAGMRCKINLIPLNTSYAGFNAPIDEEIDEFKKELKKNNIFFTLRKSRGQDIKAACGQLRASLISNSKK